MGVQRVRERVRVLLILVLLLCSVLLSISPVSRANSWTETTNVDFADGTFAGTQVVGFGANAAVQINRTHDDWINMTPERMPLPRDGFGLAYDKESGVMTLFGGYVPGVGNTNETWEYDFDTNNWTKVLTNGTPPARSFHGMAYDIVDKVTVLFGGFGDSGFLDDTWEYYASNHTWVEVATTTHPSFMSSSPMVFDSSGQRIIMVGEDVATQDFQTWRYDAFQNTWTELYPIEEPPSRTGHALAYDKKAGRVVLFGGAIGMDLLGDTWEFDSFNNKWINTMQSGPAPRMGASMEYLPFWEGIVLFGGLSTEGWDNETWLYKSFGGPEWDTLYTTIAPEGRRFMEMEYDYRSDMILMFSGEKNSTRFNDTWLFGPTYAPEGKYGSSLYDSGYAETDWSAIWWNQTAAERPKHTQILVQLAASNYSSGPFSFGGPDGSHETYYALGEGETVWEGLHGRFLKYGVTLRTYHGLETPSLEDITIAFDYVPAPPKILKTEPYNGEVNVNVGAAVRIYFSERMDKSSVQVSIQPNVTFWREWREGDSILLLHHNDPFQESTTYTIEVSAKDPEGNGLAPGPVPNPWTFNVEDLYPYIMYHTPDHQEEGIPLTTPIEILFTESMNKSTFIWNITPDPGGWSESWSTNDTKVVLTHSNLFDLCTWYEAEVRYAEDLSGNQLVPHHVSNPWIFKTYCDAPFITSTYPGNLWPNVELNTSIYITFNEAMDQSSLQWTVDPDPGGWTTSWTSPLEVGLHHSVGFSECLSYTVNVTQAKDLSGKDLTHGPVPNPWSFVTICDNPYIVETLPADGDENVAVNASIHIVFSEIMDTETFMWEIDPDPGIWDQKWELFVLTLTPLQVLAACTNHTLEVTYAQDKSGNPLIPGPAPNPFTFKTACDRPVILWTEPQDQATGVALDAPILVKWSEPMNTSAFTWDIDPDIDLTDTWNLGEDLVTLAHNESFIGGATYTVYVDGYDKEGNQWRPGPAPNPWKFSTVEGDNPHIILKDPDTGEQDVPFFKNITIVFSKSMNESTVNWSIAPSLGLSASWSDNSTHLVLSHVEPFIECAIYDFEVDGYDWQGLRLAPPKTWWFTAMCFRPYIISTSPAHQQDQVPLSETVVVEFSETINETSLNWTITPDPGGWTIDWNWNSSTAYFNHSVDFVECQEYEMEILEVWDVEGRTMEPGLVPNPWTFMTYCENPYIILTDPHHLEEEIPYNYTLTVLFSEPMATDTVSWSLDPNYQPPETIVFTVQWFDNDTRAVFTHLKDFHVCQEYSFWISSGADKDYLPLVPGPAPNPWNFTTICPNPYIIHEEPLNEEEGVTLTKSIKINFSEPMNKLTFVWSITPDPGSWSQSWNPANDGVILSHLNLFEHCTWYQVEVTHAEDMDGNPLVPGPFPLNETYPNPWTFRTYCDAPFIASTDPEHQEQEVNPRASINITFSEAIDDSSFLYTVDPGPPGMFWEEDWVTPSKVILNHTPFWNCTSYTIHVIRATDLEGKDLVPGPVPNPWTFTTYCQSPYIARTDPRHEEEGVPQSYGITVEFSEPMATDTVEWTLTPNDPPEIVFNVQWFSNDTIALFTHLRMFDSCLEYSFWITNGTDKDNNQLVPGPVPNPWTFKVECPNPRILSTDPKDRAAGVPLDAPLVIVFDRPMDTTTLNWTIDPDPGGWTHAWQDNDTRLVLSHSNLFANDTTYVAHVLEIYDTLGNPLVPGPVPNPWQFTTGTAVSTPRNLEVWRFFPNDVVVVWDAVLGATSYHVYHTTDRFEPWPWVSMMEITAPTTSALLAGHLTDGLDHYYIVRAYNDALGEESTNSTMGVKVDESFVTNPMKASIYWMSLPYESIYSKASDIASELTESKVNLIAKWDRNRQEVISYYFARGKWRGRDFALNPGDGFYVSVVSDFSWYINGTDLDMDLDLGFLPTPTKKNAHWVSLPYTSTYAKASDIVLDIEGGLGPGTNAKITEVRKWDPLTGTEIVFFYDGSGWSGDDFDVLAGEGVCLRVVTSFSWSPALLTPVVD